jgi:hypothetical protein
MLLAAAFNSGVYVNIRAIVRFLINYSPSLKVFGRLKIIKGGA